MTRLRFGLVLGLASLLVAGSAGAADACVVQSIGPVGLDGPAHPGETVHWSLTKLDPGAHYTVSIGGIQQAEGTAVSSGEQTGSFEMPDFGPAPRQVTLNAVVTHEDIPGGETPVPYRTVDYAPTPASSPPPVTATPAPTSAAPAQEPVAAGRKPVRRADRHAVTLRPAPRHTEQRPSVTRPPAAEPVTTSGPVATATPVAMQAGTARPAHRSPARRRARTADRTAVTQPAPEFPSTVPAVAPRAVVAARAAKAESGSALEEALVALGLALLVGLGGTATWIRLRRRRGPPESGDAIEAELQEIIAEERAAAPRAEV